MNIFNSSSLLHCGLDAGNIIVDNKCGPQVSRKTVWLIAKKAWDDYGSKLKTVYVPGDVYTEIGCEDFCESFCQVSDINTSEYGWKRTFEEENCVLPEGFTGVVIGITDNYDVILGACNQTTVDKP